MPITKFNLTPARLGKTGPTPLATEQRLIRKRQVDANGCWLWTGVRTQKGYGLIGFGSRASDSKRRKLLTHRVAAAIWKGFDLDSDLMVLHRCDNPPCFNPDHLFFGTGADNMADAKQKDRLRVGERAPGARLTVGDVRRMRQLYSSGMSCGAIARLFNMSYGGTSGVVKRLRWRHIV